MSTRRFRTFGLGSIVFITIGLAAACQQEGLVGSSPSAPTQTAVSPSSATQSKGATTTAQATSSRPSADETATTPATSAPAFGPVSAANLPTSPLITSRRWTAKTSVGWDSTEQSCGAVNVIGAQHVQRRHFVGSENDGATAYVMDFSTGNEATAAAKAIAASYQKCTTETLSYESEPAALTTAPQKSPVTPVSAQAHRMRPADDAHQPAVNGLVIQVGTRLMWVDIVEYYGSACSVGATLETCPVYANANDLALLLMAN